MRNLREQDLRKRVTADDDNAPTFGFRVVPNKWQWEPKTPGDGLSVNCTECCCSPKCSIQLYVGTEQYIHVTHFELSELSSKLGMDLVAVHAPLDGNPCHYCVIVGDDEKMIDLYAKLKLNFGHPMVVKVPTEQSEIDELRRRQKDHDFVFSVVRNASESGGTDVATTELGAATSVPLLAAPTRSH